MTDSNIPKRFVGVNFETDIVERSKLPDGMVAIAEDWFDEMSECIERFKSETGHIDAGLRNVMNLQAEVPSWGVLLSGAPGVGKSWLVASLLNHAEELGVSCHWVSAQNLIASYFRKMELNDIIKKLTTLDDNTPELVEKRSRDAHLWWLRNECEVLVIDDLGREREAGSGFVSSILDEVIRTRVDNGLCTHITTNLLFTKGQFSDRYGEPLASLLKEVSRGYEETKMGDYREEIQRGRK